MIVRVGTPPRLGMSAICIIASPFSSPLNSFSDKSVAEPLSKFQYPTIPFSEPLSTVFHCDEISPKDRARFQIAISSS